MAFDSAARPDARGLREGNGSWAWIFAPFLLVFLFFAARGDAQVSASVSGAVKDTDGAAVVGAQVTVKSLETGTVRAVTTGDRGEFLAPSLPLGPQEVSVEKPGFKTELRTGINLDVGQESVINFTLAVGRIAQQVTVSANAPLVNTTTAETSGFVSQREVKSLPLNGRSWDNLIALNPGAIDYVLKSPNTTTSNGNTFSVAGLRPMDNLVLLNGIEYTGASLQAVTPGGVSGGLLGVDAVREFNVLTDTYSAKYGKRAGAQVSVVTQSGTNQLHGSLYEFLRNSAMDARNFFDKGAAPPLRRNQFGASLGGPLRRNRLFLFGNFEEFRQVLAQSNVAVAPDDQARQGLLPDASGTYRKVPNLLPAMLDYMPFWPEPNGPELTVNGLPSGTALAYSNPRQTINEEFGTVRVDYIPRDQDSIAIAYTIDNGSSLTPLGDPLFGSSLNLRSQVASLQETHLFSPRTLNTFRAGFSRAAFNYGSFSLLTYAPKLSFVSGEGPGGIVIGGGLTTTGLAAITPAGPNNASNVRSHRNLFTWSDDLQASRGRNQFDAGIWFQRVQNNDDTASTTLGLANFSNLQTFLQGEVSNFNVVPSRTELGWRSLLGAWYFEDTIQLNANLSLRAGIRHEFTTGWNEAHGRAANYITGDQGVLLTTPRIGGSALTKNNAERLLGPRVALAWDVFGDGKTAVHAGFGVYYSLLDDLSKLDGIPPFNGTLSFSNVPLASIVPIAPGTPPNPSCGPGVPAPCITYAPQGVQPDVKTPTVQEWSLRTEQQLDRETVLRIGYVGSFGYHELVSVDPNTVPARICANQGGCQSGGIGAAKGEVAPGAQYIPVAASRPNPYLTAGFFWYSEGNSSYNALQVELVRRLSRGLQLRGNFTWAKNLDVNSAVQGAQANNQAQMVMDPNDLHRDWGRSALGVATQSNISWTYELPLGRGERFFGQAGGWAGKLASGWQFNGIVTLLSGFAFSPQTGSNRSGDGDSRNPDRPSLNPDFHGSVISGKQTEWFNPNAFTLPVAGTWGNASRGSLLGPGLAEVDLSLFKTIPLTERLNLEFRAEGFNVPNRANFSTPNATVFSRGAISPSAGLITSTTTTSRQLQLGMKLIF